MASWELLEREYLQALRQALTNCLETSVAEYTYAQILDGRPTALVYCGEHHIEDDWPMRQHEEICPGFLDKAKAFRSDFDVLALKFEAKVITTPCDTTSRLHIQRINIFIQTLQAYQDAKCHSVAWKLRLIELVAVACHNIAVFLSRMDMAQRTKEREPQQAINGTKALAPSLAVLARSLQMPPALPKRSGGACRILGRKPDLWGRCIV